METLTMPREKMMYRLLFTYKRRRGRKYTDTSTHRPQHDVHYSSADTREERAYFK